MTFFQFKEVIEIFPCRYLFHLILQDRWITNKSYMIVCQKLQEVLPTHHFNSILMVYHVQQRVGFFDVFNGADICESKARDRLRKT